jgi:hypothetical protein
MFGFLLVALIVSGRILGVESLVPLGLKVKHMISSLFVSIWSSLVKKLSRLAEKMSTRCVEPSDDILTLFG